jgi:hypothetical protein
VLVVCLSPNYLRSDYCKWEWEEFTRVHAASVGRTRSPRAGDHSRLVAAFRKCAEAHLTGPGPAKPASVPPTRAED